MPRHEIVTTEKVILSYGVAGVGARHLAWLVDAGVILLLCVAGIGLASALEGARSGVGIWLLMIWFFVLQWGYFLFFEWLWQGQTPGKRLMGIRVLTREGTSPSFFQSAVRNIVRWVDALPTFGLIPCYGLGFAIAALNRDSRRLGDLAAGTLVVYSQRRRPLIRALRELGSAGDLGRDPGLRQRLEGLDRAQKQALLDVCFRREQLHVSDRARLFAAIAEYARTRFGLESAEFESDEKFVLRLAATFTAEPSLIRGEGPGARGQKSEVGGRSTGL